MSRTLEQWRLDLCGELQGSAAAAAKVVSGVSTGPGVVSVDASATQFVAAAHSASRGCQNLSSRASAASLNKRMRMLMKTPGKL